MRIWSKLFPVQVHCLLCFCVIVLLYKAYKLHITIYTVHTYKLWLHLSKLGSRGWGLPSPNFLALSCERPWALAQDNTVYLYAMQVASFWGATHCIISPSYLTEPTKSKKQTLVANSTALAWCLARHSDTSEGTWTATSLARHYRKGVACETTCRSEPSPSPASLVVGSTPRAKKKVFTRTSGHQKRHLTVLTFLLYEQ